jgi:hypothetical protein
LPAIRPFSRALPLPPPSLPGAAVDAAAQLRADLPELSGQPAPHGQSHVTAPLPTRPVPRARRSLGGRLGGRARCRQDAASQARCCESRWPFISSGFKVGSGSIKMWHSRPTFSDSFWADGDGFWPHARINGTDRKQLLGGEVESRSSLPELQLAAYEHGSSAPRSRPRLFFYMQLYLSSPQATTAGKCRRRGWQWPLGRRIPSD